ncbi:MAG: hypothetical protein AB8B87_13115 [Granulosicoccus sp.]
MPLHAIMVVLATLSLWMAGSSAHAQTTAGTRIVNQAQISYVDSVTGDLIQLSSNLSTINVGEPTPKEELPAPATPVPMTVLRIEKTISETLIQPGDVVNYHIVVHNESDEAIEDLKVVDTPPEGFRYVSGSALMDSLVTDDPEYQFEGEIPEQELSLHFDLDSLASGASRELSYQMEVTAAAVDSDGINSAAAIAVSNDGAVIASQISRVGVEIVRNGTLSNEAILFGKVYVDSSCDGIQNHSEWPIAGVRLFLQDGTVVSTDEDGQYSVFGLKAGLHVIKIDTETLPEGLLLKPLDTRQAADPESRFVELSQGDFHRADFATNCPQKNPDAMFEHLAERSQSLRGDWLLSTEERNGAPIQAIEELSGIDNPLRTTIDRGTSNSTDADEPVLMGDAKLLVSQITEKQAAKGTWLWPVDEFSTDGRFMAVVRAGLEPRLFVNDREVSGDQIGERLINRPENAEIIAWYGVRLDPGINTVDVRALDAFGNERVLVSADFKRPAAATRLTLRAKQVTLPADGGRTAVPIDILITDANGYPASGVYFVTLDSSEGDFLEPDLQPDEPGVQRRVENGMAKVHLRSSDVTGELRVVARSATLTTTMNFSQVAASRPLIGAGLVEVGGSWGEVENHGNAVGDIEQGFDVDARVALFLKGHIRRDMQLTLAYDSMPAREEINVLRDPDTESRYEVRGDASRARVEAQSRSKLYLKLERERHSVLWGDYLTDAEANPIDLARVQKTLTGVNGVYDNGKTRINVFAAEQSDARASEEIRGNGTAMLFTLSGAPIITNSEVIERIVRSRDNPGLVLSSQTLMRNSDYFVNPTTGLLSFSDTVPSVDEELNPVFLRISYDQAGELATHIISGLRVNHQINDSIHVGASITDDRNPTTGFRIAGLHANFQPTADTSISIATAIQDYIGPQESGNAQRFQLEHRWRNRPERQTRFVWAQADSNFTNAGSGISAGRKEWRLTHTHPFSNTLKAVAEAIHSESSSEGVAYTSTGIRFDKTLKDWTLGAGFRRIDQQTAARSVKFNTAMISVEKRIQLGSRAGSIGIDYERDITDDSRYQLGVNMRAEVHDHIDLYTRYEVDRGLASQSLLGKQGDGTQLIVGVTSDVLASTELYSEYRMRGSFSGQSMEAVSGARSRFELEPGLSINPAAEYIQALEGENVEDAIAVSMGISDVRNPNRRVSGQAELRHTESSRYLGVRATLAQRLNINWTGLLKEELTRQTPEEGEMTLRHRLTAGLAHRPKHDNRHHMLLLAKWHEDRGPADGADGSAYILSNHHNRQINSKLTAKARLAGKWQKQRFSDKDITSKAMLTDVRLTYDIDRRWEMDIRAGWLGTSSIRTGRFSTGIGIHWLVDKNLRLGVGYNFIGFKDRELDEQNYNAKGVHLGLQMKFDEDWFQWLAFDK